MTLLISPRYQHVAWIYSFRFLRVSLSLDLCLPQETLAALQCLRRIASVASSRGDVAIVVTASVMEALTHVRASSSPESLQHAQSALATARSYQLHDMVTALPQLTAMIHFVDVFCGLQDFEPTQAINKMQAMHSVMAPAASDDQWRDDGCFVVPLTGAENSKRDVGSGGLGSKDERGRAVLTFKWMPRSDIYALAYLLSGSVIMHRNSWSGLKTEKYLREGLRMTQGKHFSSSHPKEELI